MAETLLNIPYLTTAPLSASDGFAYINCRNGWAGNDSPAEASFQAWYDSEYLHVAFSTRNVPLRVTNYANQSPVSEDSCCEIFIEPFAGGEYWNLEFNAAGAVNASHRLTRPDRVRLTDEEIAQIVRHAEARFAEPIELSGSDNSWRMQVDIPWSLLGVQPVKGFKFRANVYAIASKGVPTYALSWAPINTEKPDFHRPEFFGTFILD